MAVRELDGCTRNGLLCWSRVILSTGPCELRIAPPIPTPTPSFAPNLISDAPSVCVRPICCANINPGRLRGCTRSVTSGGSAADWAKKNWVCPVGDVGSSVRGDARLRGRVWGVGRWMPLWLNGARVSGCRRWVTGVGKWSCGFSGVGIVVMTSTPRPRRRRSALRGGSMAMDGRLVDSIVMGDGDGLNEECNRAAGETRTRCGYKCEQRMCA